jgi:hypothetical protein
MPLFRVNARGVLRIAPDEARLREDKIHQLIETNLSTLFDDLVLVARKPRIGGKEFDTLALNTATNTPVIIEYKRGKDRGVVEQVDMYYVKLRHNKPDVMMLFQRQEAVEDLGEIDFDDPQIIIVAREFTPEQRELLAMKRQYLRLFRYQLYREGVLSLEEVEPLGPLSEVATSIAVRRASSQYGIDHFGMRTDIRKLYEQLDKGIVSLDSRVKPGKVNKYFIGYGATGSYFCNLKPRVNSIRVEVKCRRKPRRLNGLKLRPISEYQHTPMTHVFDLTSERQLRSGLKAIKEALEDSM